MFVCLDPVGISVTAQTAQDISIIGWQWLSGRVLDSRPRGRGFQPHRLSTGSTQEDLSLFN